MTRSSDFQNAQAFSDVNEAAWVWMGLLRFCLAFIIVSAHSRISSQAGWLRLPVIFGSFAAVLSFLLISGFSIAHSVSQKSGGFQLRRIARVFPMHAAILALFSLALILLNGIIVAHGAGSTVPPVQFIPFLFNLLLLNGSATNAINGPTWSLACEVFFYCCAPFFLWLVTRHRYALLPLIGVSSLLYFFQNPLHLPPEPEARHGIAALELFWAWGGGFYYYFYRNTVLARGVLILLGSALIPAIETGGPYGAFTLLITAFLLLHADTATLKNGGLNVFFNYLGDLSYPMFLCHLPIIVLLNGVWGIKSSSIIVCGVLAASILLFHAIDRPCRRAIGRRKSWEAAAKRLSYLFIGLYILLCLTSLKVWAF